MLRNGFAQNFPLLIFSNLTCMQSVVNMYAKDECTCTIINTSEEMVQVKVELIRL